MAPSRSAWAALALLALVYTLNFLDRTLIYILFGPIKQEMALTDLQLALLGSTSFVLFYTALGVPFGRLADRVHRGRLIAGGLLVWSVFSGLTGFARSFETLLLCRIGVGIGEATLGPAAMSLLSDHFPPARRGAVQSAYSVGIPLGAAAAFFGGGAVAAELGWRAAFMIFGFPGALVALLVLLLREPARGGTEGAAPAAPVPMGEGLRSLAANPVLRRHVFGYAALAVASNSLSIWLPTLLAREHGLPIIEIGQFSGFAMAFAGTAGTLLGGPLADLVARRGPGGRLRFGAGAAALTGGLWAVLLASGDLAVFKLAYVGLAAVGLAWLGPAAADVHGLAGARLRGLGVASYLLVVNLVGYGAAPALTGWLSDRLGAAGAASGLHLALWLCPVACAAAALSLLDGARRWERRVVAPPVAAAPAAAA